MNKRLYIAYGSNLHIKQMSFRCPQSKPVGTATLKDHRLVFQGSAFGAHANVIPEAGQEVPVVIWQISQRDEAMLDRYEGVAGGYYTKEYMTIDLNGEQVEALIYIMTPHGYGLPSDIYLNTIKEGYGDFNLPIKCLNEAVVHSYNKTHKKGAVAW